MIADGLTKALPINKWTIFLDHLGLVDVRDRQVTNNAPLEEIQEQLDNLSLIT
jgi:hypothetical protein